MLNLGKTTRVGKWTWSRARLSHTRDWKAWIEERLPDPMDLPRHIFDALPLEEQVARHKRRQQIKEDLANFHLRCELSMEFIRTETGAAKFAQIMLEEHHKGITEDESLDAFAECGEELEKILDNAEGELPKGRTGDLANLSIVPSSPTGTRSTAH